MEYLSSYNLSFKVGVLCLHWNSTEFKPNPNIQSPPLKYERSDDTFSYAYL